MYDLIIIGASASGCAASIYAYRRNLNFKIISKDVGGEVLTSGDIENYLGFSHIDGVELVSKFKDHLKSYNIKVDEGTVDKIEKNGDFFSVYVKDEKFDAKSIILATGSHPRKLAVKGEDKFYGKGVTYCTICDGPLFKGKVTATIGGGNSGLESALMMKDIAKKVYLLEYEDKLNGDDILIKKVLSSNKIEVITNAKTKEIKGNAMVKSLLYENRKTKKIEELKLDGVMAHIGLIPNSEIAPNEVLKNKFNEILVDCSAKTNVPGFFASGDVTAIPYKQIGIAGGYGILAALSAVEYLNKLS